MAIVDQKVNWNSFITASRTDRDWTDSLLDRLKTFNFYTTQECEMFYITQGTIYLFQLLKDVQPHNSPNKL